MAQDRVKLNVKAIGEDMRKRMSLYHSSLEPTDDEVTIAYLLCEISRLEGNSSVSLDKKLHTLNSNIPADVKQGDNRIGMDTKPQKKGLHLWIGNYIETGVIPFFTFKTVHLTRKDARNLIEEIQHRLF